MRAFRQPRDGCLLPPTEDSVSSPATEQSIIGIESMAGSILQLILQLLLAQLVSTQTKQEPHLGGLLLSDA